MNFLMLISPGRFPIGSTLVLGFVLGLKHALDDGLPTLGFGTFLAWDVGLIQSLLG